MDGDSKVGDKLGKTLLLILSNGDGVGGIVGRLAMEREGEEEGCVGANFFALIDVSF